MQLFRLIYFSSAQPDISNQNIEEIVDVSRKNNEKLNISGMLLFINNKFIQVLEGSKKDVAEIFDKIKSDNRHTDIQVILKGYTNERSFPNWSMGLKIVSEEDFNALKELNQNPNFNLPELLNEKSDLPHKFLKNFYDNGDLNFQEFWNYK